MGLCRTRHLHVSFQVREDNRCYCLLRQIQTNWSTLAQSREEWMEEKGGLCPAVGQNMLKIK